MAQASGPGAIRRPRLVAPKPWAGRPSHLTQDPLGGINLSSNNLVVHAAKHLTDCKKCKFSVVTFPLCPGARAPGWSLENKCRLSLLGENQHLAAKRHRSRIKDGSVLRVLRLFAAILRCFVLNLSELAKENSFGLRFLR